MVNWIHLVRPHRAVGVQQREGLGLAVRQQDPRSQGSHSSHGSLRVSKHGSIDDRQYVSKYKTIWLTPREWLHTLVWRMVKDTG
jgi:hypothetical protein